ncbi:DUF1444 family protein [Sphingomonas sp. ASY06-1R]|uniref:DUF1444 family protein n=1 Tax=Sphingomonas sp. ASY06-1R TaxID=3445771 RepID=UPI003FA2EA55
MMRFERRRLMAAGIMSFGLTWLFGRKAEARSFSNVAALRDHVVKLLRTQEDFKVTPDRNDPAKFQLAIDDWSVVGDVTNLFNYMKGNPQEDPDFLVRRFLNSLAEGQLEGVDDAHIVAVIRAQPYIDAALKAGGELLHEPLGADLQILYMADRQDSMAPLSPKDVPGKDLASLRAIAMNNERRWLSQLVSDESLKPGMLYYVEDNPMLSPTLLLLDDFWKMVAQRFPGDVIIALPRKDQLFLFDDEEEARQRARQLIEVTFAEDYNLLSSRLYARRNGKITVVPD